MICIPEHIKTQKDLPLCNYSTFKIGGTADLAIFPKNTEEFILAVDTLKNENIRFDVIGNGSNILFDDNGYRGAVIFTRQMAETTYENDGEFTLVHTSCGTKLTGLAIETLKKHRLAGLEFAYGIPGSMGGAVYMNAGAHGGEMSDILTQSICFDAQNGKIITLSAEEHEFSYRKSIFQRNKDLFVLSSTIRLSADDGSALSKAEANMLVRREKQPLEFPSAGSVFKRPEGLIAAKLIDDAGLKGTCVGGACVSQKHAGFIINQGNATSADVFALTDIIKAEVFKKFGVHLELEIIYLPEK